MLPEWARAGRQHWRFTGAERPEFAVEPGPGQESVWDYPRPPRLVPEARTVELFVGETLLARTNGSFRILETASPPTFYLPPDAFDQSLLRPAAGGSRCEWKGEARYQDVVVGDRVLRGVVWSYPEPFAPFQAIRGYLSCYPAAIRCHVSGERVRPQPGGFYGGWVTDEIVGPFKGEPGTGGW